jgi:hypothetical protein
MDSDLYVSNIVNHSVLFSFSNTGELSSVVDLSGLPHNLATAHEHLHNICSVHFPVEIQTQ